jgi:hypothetical protein
LPRYIYTGSFREQLYSRAHLRRPRPIQNYSSQFAWARFCSTFQLGVR